MAEANKSGYLTGRTLAIRSKEVIRLRMQNGWSQAELADEAGCSAATIQNVEKGRNVYLATARLIAKAFGVKVETLLQPGDEGVVPGNEDGQRLLISGIEISIKLNVPFSQFDETHDLFELISKLSSVLPKRSDVGVLKVTDGSTIVTVETDWEGARNIAQAFGRREFDKENVIEISIHTHESKRAYEIKENLIKSPNVYECEVVPDRELRYTIARVRLLRKAPEFRRAAIGVPKPPGAPSSLPNALRNMIEGLQPKPLATLPVNPKSRWQGFLAAVRRWLGGSRSSS